MNASSSSEDHVADIIFCLLNGVAFFVCLAAAILVFALRLHVKIVYRLSLYQVLAGIAFATAETLEIVFLNYDKSPQVYARLCIAIGFFVLYTEWIKVFFTMCVTFHIFCFAVLHKNLKKLEALYVVTSLLVPALFAIIPLITHTYHNSTLGCYINKYNDTVTDEVAEIERLALWDVPAMVILFAVSTAMVIMMIKLTYRVCLRRKSEPITDGDQNWKALKQLLPLAAFPIVFFVFVIPGLIRGIYLSTNTTVNKGALFTAVACIAMWGMASGASLIIHISVARLYCKKKRKRPLCVSSNYQTIKHAMDEPIVNETMSSVTHFSLPEESAAEDN